MIVLREASFGYAKGRDILAGCSLALRAGDQVALAGPNGAGKSTLLKLAAGLIEPKKGTVELERRLIGAWNRVERAKRLAYVPQNPTLPPDWPAGDLVALGDFPHREDPPAPRTLGERLDEARRTMELDGLWERPAGTLSGGEAQRVALARALVQDTAAFVLDEPASHLDIRHQMALGTLLATLAAKGRTILFSTLDINLSRLHGARLVLLDGSGTIREFPADASGQGRLLEEVFGVAFAPGKCDGFVWWNPCGEERKDEGRGMRDEG